MFRFFVIFVPIAIFGAATATDTARVKAPMQQVAQADDQLPPPPAEPTGKQPFQPAPVVIEHGPLLPTLDVPKTLSARLGEMVSVRVDGMANVQFIEWEVEPQPDSVRIIGVNKTEFLFSSTTEGRYEIRINFSGPGGIGHRKCTVYYGTAADGNVTAPAGENMVLDEANNFETVIVKAFRHTEDPDKDHKRFDAADAIEEVCALADGANPNITTRDEIPSALNDAFRRKLRGSYAAWSPFIRKLSQALSDAFDSGQAQSVSDYVTLLRATAEILRGK